VNKTNGLDNLIKNAWDQLKEAASNENWSAVQQAFRKMATLQELDQQSRSLQQRILDELSSTGALPVTPQPPFFPVDHSGRTRRGTRRPKELRIGPYHLPISINNQIAVATANWILKQGKMLPKMSNFVHPTNSGFAVSAQTRRLDDGSFIEIGDSQDTLIQKARKLLNVCGFSELKLEVLLEDGTLRTA
jgi:hypothetical protein